MRTTAYDILLTNLNIVINPLQLLKAQGNVFILLVQYPELFDLLSNKKKEKQQSLTVINLEHVDVWHFYLTIWKLYLDLLLHHKSC